MSSNRNQYIQFSTYPPASTSSIYCGPTKIHYSPPFLFLTVSHGLTTSVAFYPSLHADQPLLIIPSFQIIIFKPELFSKSSTELMPNNCNWSTVTTTVPHFHCKVDLRHHLIPLHCQVPGTAATSTYNRSFSLHMHRPVHNCLKLYTFSNVYFSCLYYLVLTTYIHITGIYLQGALIDFYLQNLNCIYYFIYKLILSNYTS